MDPNQNQTPSTPSSPPSGGTDNAVPGTPEAVDFGELLDSYEETGNHGPGSVDPATPPVSGAGETPPAAPPDPLPASLQVPAQPPAAPATPPAAAPPAAAATPPPTPPEPQAPQPPVATGTPPATDPAAAPPAVPELTLEQHRGKYLPVLEQQYQLSEAEVEEFRTAPEKALPKLASRLHYEVAMALRGGMEAILPQMIQQAMVRSSTESANEAKFFGAWPKLKEAADRDPKAVEVIRNSIMAFRQVNPKASMEDLIKQAGMVACYTLQIPPDGVVPTPPAAPAAPAAPVVAQVPPRPPGVGASGHVPAAPVGTPAPGADGVDWGELVSMHESGQM